MARVIDTTIPPITNGVYDGIYGSPAGGILGLGGGVPTPSVAPPVSAAPTTVPPQNPMTPLTSQAGPGPMLASATPNPAPAANTAPPLPPPRPTSFPATNPPATYTDESKRGFAAAARPAPAPAVTPPPMPPIRPATFPMDQTAPGAQPIAHVAGPAWLKNFFLAGQSPPTGMTGILNAQRNT